MTTGHRHRGGLASFVGNEYEQLFGVYRVVLALESLRRGTALRLALQLKGCAVERQHFQLRRRGRQSWRDVREAFTEQLRAGRGTPMITWVVAHPKQAKRLQRSTGRIAQVRIEYFPGWLGPDRHVVRGPAHLALRAACVVALPTLSDLEAIWKDVAFAWESVRRPGRFVAVEQVLGRIDAQSQSPLRFLWSAPKWWTPAERLLRKVDGFTFRVEDGHLFYDSGAGLQGRFSCRSSGFREFAARVVARSPRVLSEVLELL